MMDFIPDGYTESAYIKSEDRVHGEFRFTYRPMLVEERTILYSKAMEHLSDEAQLKKRAAAVVARIQSWSLLDAKGQAAPIKVETYLRLKAPLFWRVLNIVVGADAGDLDPEAEAADTLALIDQRIQAAVEGRGVAELRETADAKN